MQARKKKQKPKLTILDDQNIYVDIARYYSLTLAVPKTARSGDSNEKPFCQQIKIKVATSTTIRLSTSAGSWASSSSQPGPPQLRECRVYGFGSYGLGLTFEGLKVLPFRFALDA